MKIYGPINHQKMMISGPRNLHYNSALFLDPEIIKMGQFLGQESIRKWWFLGPVWLWIISGSRNCQYDKEILYHKMIEGQLAKQDVSLAERWQTVSLSLTESDDVISCSQKDKMSHNASTKRGHCFKHNSQSVFWQFHLNFNNSSSTAFLFRLSISHTHIQKVMDQMQI